MSDEDRANNAGKMAEIIFRAISCTPFEIQQYSPDALIRVFIYLGKINDFSLEKMKNEVLYALEYYYQEDDNGD